MKTIVWQRPGFSLIELVGVIALTSVLMMVAVSLLGWLLRWSTTAADYSQQLAAAHRLEQALRPQLREATRIEALGDTLRVATPTATAEWKLTSGECQLTTQTEDGPRFDRFAIGPRDHWQATVDEQFVEVQLLTAAEQPGQPVRLVVARRLPTTE